jgi:Spy/CpxP family protein refolding chaperone
MSKSFSSGKSGFLADTLKTLAIAALAIAPLMTTESAYAQEPGAAQPQHDPAALYLQVGADNNTVQKVRQLAADFEATIRPKYEGIMTQMREMQRLSLEPNLDEAKILATQEAINRATGDMATERIKLLINQRKLLSPEQRAKFVELLKQQRSQKGPQ